MFDTFVKSPLKLDEYTLSTRVDSIISIVSENEWLLLDVHLLADNSPELASYCNYPEPTSYGHGPELVSRWYSLDR